MLLGFCEALERAGIAYVILSGYQTYPKQIPSDVDFMVSERDFARLPALFSKSEVVPGARLVQMLHHETSACYFVLAQQIGAHIAFLHPDASASYRRGGRLWLRSDHVLKSRRKSAQGFWIPAAEVEFEYYFVKRVDKTVVESRHLQHLAALISEAPDACKHALERLMGAKLAPDILSAITAVDVDWFGAQKAALQHRLAQSASKEALTERLRGAVADMGRLTHRILYPTGLVVAVLGPDGSGKTTVIEHLERELAPAFRRVRRFHLRPRFGSGPSNAAPVTNPHGEAPRGRLASVAKLALFLADYWLGWLRLVLPARAKSTLVVFDRYFHDMLVDPRRYRLPVRFSGAQWLAPGVPQPDLWLVLHASPEQLVARKGEIDLATATRLSAGYAALARRLPNAVLVDTGQTLDRSLADAVSAVRRALENRARGRIEQSAA